LEEAHTAAVFDVDGWNDDHEAIHFRRIWQS
jgi:hypothetical protein